MKLKLRYLIGLTVFTVVAIAVILWGLSQPVSGKIKNAQSTRTSEFAVSLIPKLASDQYASFDYPSGMLPQPTQQFKSPILAEFLFKALDIQSWILSVDIINNPTADIANNSSYIIRNDNPNNYRKSYLQIGKQTILVMTDTAASGFSEVAYLERGSLLATISLMGDDPQGTQPLQKTFMMVLDSWQWL